MWLRRAAWPGLSCVLLLSLALCIALPLLDHHAAERDPLHGHLVLSGSAAAQAQALASHHHSFEAAHAHVVSPALLEPSDVDRELTGDAPRVIVLQGWDGSDVASVSGAGLLLLAPDWPELAPPRLSEARLFPRLSPLVTVALPTPEPPPRAAV
ncbi:MAG: hypothetical protein GEU73_13760 [Chloroflexi bacterium]|nr:hypothetical protein [Chloroflexota bacterium]